MFLGVIGRKSRHADRLEKTLQFTAAVLEFFLCQSSTKNKEADVDRSLPCGFQLHTALLDCADFLPDAEIDKHSLSGFYHFLR